MSSLSGHVDFSSFEPLHSEVKNSDPFFLGPESVYIIHLNAYAYTMYYISPCTHRFYKYIPTFYTYIYLYL